MGSPRLKSVVVNGSVHRLNEKGFYVVAPILFCVTKKNPKAANAPIYLYPSALCLWFAVVLVVNRIQDDFFLWLLNLPNAVVFLSSSYSANKQYKSFGGSVLSKNMKFLLWHTGLFVGWIVAYATLKGLFGIGF
jgi:hypothetical protein